MSAKEIKLHSLVLAGNVGAKNFAVETLAVDPALTRAGQFWTNSEDKGVKFSALNDQGALVVKTITDKATLDAAVTLLTQQITNVSGGSSAAIDAERAARVAAITALNTALGEETAARIAADATEQAARIAGDASEAARADAAIAALQATTAGALQTETAARIAGDSAAAAADVLLQAELDRTQAGAGLAANGDFKVKADANFIATATNLTDAVELLDVQAQTEKTERTGAVLALGSAIANEAQLRADADAGLRAELKAFVNTQIDFDNVTDEQKLAVEVAHRIDGDANLQAELDRTQASIGLDTNGDLIPITGTNVMDGATTVFGAAVKLDQAIFSTGESLAAEAAARVAGDNANTAAIDAEKARALGVEGGLTTELNTVESAVGLETNGGFIAPTGTAYLSGDGQGVGAATTVKDGLVKLDAATKSVANRATAIETVAIPAVQNQIAQEVARATLAETTEATARATADDALTTRLAAEETARAGAVSTLTTAVATEKSAREAADTLLQGQIDTLTAAAGSGAAALKGTLNAGRNNYLSPAAALEHVVQHGFGHYDFIVQVKVEGDDGVFRNDVVPVEDVDANSIRINLAESRKVRVNFISTATLA